ncbi:hypothetical protein Gbth_123_002 [Gluconobacter thailandicus F149-1 = NBRC 100600]|uniref:Bleomycin resistance protein n=2 Tax=Gluconobacter thailandicus TaxID=257438 RepID=A0AAP9JHE1_GLUTH|nr:bleomycin resistance protein [Gluconobacter thailandicus]GAD28216.1 hypothetical protein NBRC3257_3215 [Gluconobacter thailandicus NBRC 3257]GAN94873.1 hypothetical protein Gbth_123_002 [Gluconobacter thailandicus F149-1 = NBRC 100600]QEH95299.1 bleomycin resistance protein [Gluconobacter thailandicus]GBR60100.1 hypothetical protein AA100600_1720 [Gluconobacter thailandicus F149-1 = NBRC 100600]
MYDNVFGASYQRLSMGRREVQTPRDAHGGLPFYFQAKGGYFIGVTTLTPVRSEAAY